MSKVFLVCFVVIAAGFGCTKENSTPTESGEPDAMLHAMRSMLIDNKPDAFWNSLPASYRHDVNELIQQFAKTMDEEVWARGVESAAKLVRVLQEKKEFILRNPMLAGVVGADKAIEEQWDSSLGFFSQLMTQNLATLDTIRELDVEEFLQGTGSQVMSVVTSASALLPGANGVNYAKHLAQFKDATIEVVDRSGDLATVVVTPPGEAPQDLAVIKVEGQWLLKDLADGWDRRMNEASAAIAKIHLDDSDRAAILQKIDTADDILDRLLAAQNAVEFNQALVGMATLVGPEPSD